MFYSGIIKRSMKIILKNESNGKKKNKSIIKDRVHDGVGINNWDNTKNFLMPLY